MSGNGGTDYRQAGLKVLDLSRVLAGPFTGGTRPITQSPYRFSAAASGGRGPAPHRGEHNAEVLAEWLGRTPAEVEALTASGVLTSEAAMVEASAN